MKFIPELLFGLVSISYAKNLRKLGDGPCGLDEPSFFPVLIDDDPKKRACEFDVLVIIDQDSPQTQNARTP